MNQDSEVKNLAILPADFFKPSSDEVLWIEFQEHIERKALLETERVEGEKNSFYDWQLDWMPEKHESYINHY